MSRYALVMAIFCLAFQGIAVAQNKLPTARSSLPAKVEVSEIALQPKFATKQELSNRLKVLYRQLEEPVTLDGRNMYVEVGASKIYLSVSGQVNPGANRPLIVFDSLDKNKRLDVFSINFEGPVLRQRKAVECEVSVSRLPVDVRIYSMSDRAPTERSLSPLSGQVLSTVVAAGERWWSVQFAKPDAERSEYPNAASLLRCVVTPIRT